MDELVIVPLFFGHSRAISSFIPATLGSIQKDHGTFCWSVANVLSPMPQGEPTLARLLYENLLTLAGSSLEEFDFIVLVDHGSPAKNVSDVKTRTAELLAPHLPDGVPLLQAAMERREGPEYDFNGPLLQDLLEKLGGENGSVKVAVSMLFISPGRHAGEGGDIAEICSHAMQRNPGLDVQVSPLVGDHTLLVDLLLERLQAML
jgi:sirohydrochlorin ferrochelatase